MTKSYLVCHSPRASSETCDPIDFAVGGYGAAKADFALVRAQDVHFVRRRIEPDLHRHGGVFGRSLSAVGDVLAGPHPFVTRSVDTLHDRTVSDALVGELPRGGHVVGVCLRRPRQQHVVTQRGQFLLRAGRIVPDQQSGLIRGIALFGDGKFCASQCQHCGDDGK